jgi:TonB family protein
VRGLTKWSSFATGNAGRFSRQKKVPLFEFSIPTERVPQAPRSLAASIVAHALAFLLLFALRFPGSVSSFPMAPQHITLLAPRTERAIVAPKIRPSRPREFRPLPPVPVHVEIPAAPAIAAPAIETPQPVLPELPHLAPAVAIAKPSGFSEAKPAAPLPAPKPAVKASGFESAENQATGPARGTLSTVGSFDSAHSAEGAPARNATAIARPGGFSDASASSASGARHSPITSGAFGDTTVEKGAAQSRQTTGSASVTPVEILSKPRPAYTAEARANNIEGEVLLEVQFSISGEARVLRVVRGLGHGLDETAIAAARGIRFRPATREGAAVDFAAIVHIVFQLAN